MMRISRCILSVDDAQFSNSNRREHIGCQHLPNAGVNLLLSGAVRVTLASASVLEPIV